MSNTEPISYLILKSPDDFSDKTSVIQQNENDILEILVQKYKIDENVENASTKIWNDIATEFANVTNVQIKGEDLRKVCIYPPKKSYF